MRVLYVVSLFPCWSETFIVREIKALQKLGVSINILSLKHAHEELVQSDAEQLADHVIYPRPMLSGFIAATIHFFKSPLANLGILLSILWGLKMQPGSLAKSVVTFWRTLAVLPDITKANVDHVHAHWATYPSTAALTIGLNSALPFSFTSHAHDIFLEDQLLTKKFKHCKFAVTISNFNIRFLKDFVRIPFEQKTHVVHCGIEVDQFSYDRNPRTANALLAVGRFDEIKGFTYLLDACAELKAKGVTFTCKVIGDGPLKEELNAKKERLQLNDCVEFLGIRPQEQVRELLLSSEMFVLPSVKTKEGNMDGIPVALMEAMAVGTPVISTKVSGIPELIEHDVNGLICEPKNASDLAEKIHYLLTEKERQNAMARKARDTIEAEFEIQTEASKILSLIRKND